MLRTLLLGAALDPTVELGAFVMGESPDFAPFRPRLSRYRMGMDDAVAEAATQALADLLDEMERRGKVLGAQPGQPPKVSRQLADRRELGLHPLVCAIDECHELFQHPKFGKRAAEQAVRLIKRGRKYGIVLLLATQSPTKDSIPREITRNVSYGVAFSVADQVANDGLLGAGKYRAGIRATDLRMHTNRGTCVAVGVTDATFELVRTFYVPFEDGIDDVSPVIARAMATITEEGRAVTAPEQTELEAAPVDHLANIAAVLRGEPRVRTQVVLARLIEHNPTEYEGWTLSRLAAALAEYGITVGKSDGRKVIRAADIARALATRTDADIARLKHGETGHNGRDADRDTPGRQGLLPHGSLTQIPGVTSTNPGQGPTRPRRRTLPKTPGIGVRGGRRRTPSLTRAGVVATTANPPPNTPNPTQNHGSNDDQEARDTGLAPAQFAHSARSVDDRPTLAKAARIVRAALARRSTSSVLASEEVAPEDLAKTP